jgi:LmbE family N-acetylglucosaminyl deacetylase
MDMGRVFFYSPHPDDETLSMGLAMLHYLTNGFEVHLVSMTSGDAVGSGYFLNGQTPDGTPVVCPTPADHPWTHNPQREGYAEVTTEAVGAARLLEARTALGLMAMVPPIPDSNGNPVPVGTVVHHSGGLHDGFGNPGSGSSTAPPTREGIDAAKAVMLPYIQDYPNSFHYTMSPSDHHKDHASCGMALREIKTENPTLLGTPRFFVSRLYWGNPIGNWPDDLRQAAGATTQNPNGSIGWFVAAGANTPALQDHLRNRVIKAYRAWNPAAGAYGIGYHQVRSQFEANFGPSATVANLWHA